MIADVLEGRARWCVLEGRWQDLLPADIRVDHVITDPPYSEWTHWKNRRNPLAGRAPLKAIPFEAITQAERIEVMDLCARSCARWSVVWTDFEGVTDWVTATVSSGMQHVRCGAWIKKGCAPQMSGDRPATGAEVACIAHHKGKKRWNGGGHAALWHHNIAVLEGGKDHVTQKPIALMLELVSLFTDPGDVILDPYCGSGTTGVACLRLGRRFIGCEMSPEYAEIARERLRAEESDSTLEERRRGQLALFGGV